MNMNIILEVFGELERLKEEAGVQWKIDPESHRITVSLPPLPGFQPSETEELELAPVDDSGKQWNVHLPGYFGGVVPIQAIRVCLRLVEALLHKYRRRSCAIT